MKALQEHTGRGVRKGRRFHDEFINQGEMK